MSLFEHTKNTRSIIKGSLRYIRSDVPTELSPEERQWLTDNNILTAVELREKHEREQKPCILKNDKAFTYIIMPVTDGGAVPTSADMVCESYIKMADDMLKSIVSTIMNCKTNVLYFCNAGKDRTRVVTAVILSRLGYGKDYITEDYMLSGENLKESLALFAEENPHIDIEVITPKAEYIEGFLEWYSNNMN